MTDLPDNITGHITQRTRLRELLFTGKLPSTLMFAGPSGVGKFLVARELLRTLLCKTFSKAESAPGLELYGGCGKCSICTHFDSATLPDLHSIDCADKEAARVEALRTMLTSVHLAPFEATSRAVLFNNAELLSVQGANILLKTLEEPGARTYFILLSSNPAKLPATVLSRCQRWYFDALSPDEITEILKRQNFAFENLSPEDVAILADGSLEHIHRIANDFELWGKTQDKLDSISSGDKDLALAYARELSGEKDSLGSAIDLMRIHARHRMLTADNSELRLKWASFLRDTITLRRLIFERNINAGYCLNTTLLCLSDTSGNTPVYLEEIAV